MVTYVSTDNADALPWASNNSLAPSQLLTAKDINTGEGASYPITTNTHWQVDWSHISVDGDPLHTWHYDFYGTGFTYDPSGMITGGTVRSFEVWEAKPLDRSDPSLGFGPATLSASLSGLNMSWQTVLNYAAQGEAGDQAFVDYVFRGNDTLTGGAKPEILDGHAGNDTISAGGGTDILIGGAGNDTLTGGADQDTFVFQAGWGKDRITDFQVGGADHDVLKFDAGLFAGTTNAERFNDLMAHTADVNGVAVIKLDKQTTITLDHVTKADLLQHPEDVWFV